MFHYLVISFGTKYGIYNILKKKKKSKIQLNKYVTKYYRIYLVFIGVLCEPNVQNPLSFREFQRTWTLSNTVNWFIQVNRFIQFAKSDSHNDSSRKRTSPQDTDTQTHVISGGTSLSDDFSALETACSSSRAQTTFVAFPALVHISGRIR